MNRIVLLRVLAGPRTYQKIGGLLPRTPIIGLRPVIGVRRVMSAKSNCPVRQLLASLR